MQQKKDADEQKLVKTLLDDVNTQMQQLNSQVTVINAAEESQMKIQNELVDLWKASCAELE